MNINQFEEASLIVKRIKALKEIIERFDNNDDLVIEEITFADKRDIIFDNDSFKHIPGAQIVKDVIIASVLNALKEQLEQEKERFAKI